jgi:hypothetical protein
VRISLGEEGRRWTLVPTMLDGKVESFVALREDAAYGDNPSCGDPGNSTEEPWTAP